ncbi:MAG TPA: hypothetical protein ENI23_12945 [bacterium]|nr:hypothetical protein [bacterium]
MLTCARPKCGHDWEDHQGNRCPKCDIDDCWVDTKVKEDCIHCKGNGYTYIPNPKLKEFE